MKVGGTANRQMLQTLILGRKLWRALSRLRPEGMHPMEEEYLHLDCYDHTILPIESSSRLRGILNQILHNKQKRGLCQFSFLMSLSSIAVHSSENHAKIKTIGASK